MNKANETQLEKEISAVKTVLDISKLIIKNHNCDAQEKEKMSTVIDDIYNGYIGKLIAKQAIETAVRKCTIHGASQQIAKETVSQIDSIEALLKGKGII